MGTGDETVEITGIAAGGAGVGRLSDGRVTFVHRTAPGDRARVRVIEDRRRWTRSRLIRLEQAAPGRRDPPCPHYDRCGGCTLEHLDYDAQLRAKARIVADALARIGGLDAIEPTVVASPDELRYRSRVTLLLRRTTRGVVAGFHEIGEPDRILDITEACLLPEPAIAGVWAELRRRWGVEANRLPSGEALRLTLRASDRGEVSLAVDGGYAAGRPDELVAGIDALVAVWHRPTGADAFRLLSGSTDDPELRADIFVQVNRSAARLLEAHVLDRVRAASPGRVVDAYSGMGLYTRRLEADGVAVTAIDVSPAAAAEARRAAPSSRVIEGRVEEALGSELPADLVIVNPPRTGLDPAVVDRLRETPPPRLLYVSCDPATLARDLARLGSDWQLADVRCFDLFPQTAHVETVVEMRCVTT